MHHVSPSSAQRRWNNCGPRLDSYSSSVDLESRRREHQANFNRTLRSSEQTGSVYIRSLFASDDVYMVRDPSPRSFALVLANPSTVRQPSRLILDSHLQRLEWRTGFPIQDSWNWFSCGIHCVHPIAAEHSSPHCHCTPGFHPLRVVPDGSEGNGPAGIRGDGSAQHPVPLHRCLR